MIGVVAAAASEGVEVFQSSVEETVFRHVSGGDVAIRNGYRTHFLRL